MLIPFATATARTPLRHAPPPFGDPNAPAIRPPSGPPVAPAAHTLCPERMTQPDTALSTATIALTRGVPDPEVLPAQQLAECFAAIITQDPIGTLQYGHFAGYTPLRKLLAEQYGVSEDEIFVSNGSLQLMDFLAAHFVRPGHAPQDTVLVE